MIEVEAAIGKARELFQAVHAELLEAGEIVDLLVEDVELSEDEKVWSVTLGFSHKGHVNPSTVGEALAQISPELVRRFKTFKVDAESGRVCSMKNKA